MSTVFLNEEYADIHLMYEFYNRNDQAYEATVRDFPEEQYYIALYLSVPIFKYAIRVHFDLRANIMMFVQPWDSNDSEKILNFFHNIPTQNIRRASSQLQISRIMIWKTL